MEKSKRAVKHFISDPILVHFSTPPVLVKKPSCPDGFAWGDEEFKITTSLAEWKDFSRRGRMAKNMQPQHAKTASSRGSWGVGRFFFDVQTDNKRCFRLYYDRTPVDSADRTGNWVLLAELITPEE